MLFKNLRNIAVTGMVVVASALSVPAEVLADDTDVFFPQNAISSEGVANPNILFVIDDSGSMTQKDNVGISRIQRVKDAFTLLMDSDSISANTNVGPFQHSGIRSLEFT